MANPKRRVTIAFVIAAAILVGYVVTGMGAVIAGWMGWL